MNQQEELLSNRYKNDGKAIIELDKTQIKAKKLVEKKILNKKYTFEKVNCIVCNSKDFKKLSEKDRHGLFSQVVICKNCGLVQTNPRMKIKSYKKFYDKEYRKLYVSEELSMQEFFQNQYNRCPLIYDFIKAALNVEIKNKFIVEIGTGAGGILKYFEEKGNKIYGLDLGSKYLKLGQRKGMHLEVGGVEKLKYLKNKPDIILYCHVLEHTLNPIKELEIAKKYLKKNGIIYIEVPSIEGLTMSSCKSDFLKYLQNAHTYHFTLPSLTNCIKKAGFSIIKQTNTIRMVIEPRKKKVGHTNCFSETMKMLKDAEKARNNLVNIPRLKGQIWIKICQTLNGIGGSDPL
jgi:2-polyprenyl-3-methyl-5-hydroxy-6-metoxy-1,4-benzoquinol methylase